MQRVGDGNDKVMHDVFTVLAEIEARAAVAYGLSCQGFVENKDVEVGNCVGVGQFICRAKIRKISWTELYMIKNKGEDED